MSTRTRVETVLICVVFAVYVGFALKLLLFSRPPGSERSFNLIPFGSVADFLFSGSVGVRNLAFGNIAGNVILFVPLGAYVSVLTNWTAARTMIIVASASIAVEVLQGVFGLGASDVSDVILNCLGGLIGIQLILLLRLLLRKRDRVRTAVAVLSIVALPVLSYLLFGIRLRM